MIAALTLPAAALSVQALATSLRPSLWLAAVLAPDPADPVQLRVHFVTMPRIAASILCGAALALAGVIFQQVLRNPLAAPSTLGVSAGAKLALVSTTLWAPGLFVFGRETVALAGGGAALAVVLALTWRKSFAPVAVVLAGLVLGLYCGAAAAALVLFEEHTLVGLFIWGSGSLSLQGWAVVSTLATQLAVTAVLLVPILRPLSVLSLEEAGARSVGVSLHGTRLAALTLAVALTAFVVSGVGVIGFVGLVAPALARLAGARRLRDRLLLAPLLGAGLLWSTDQLVQRAGEAIGGLLPTGAVTALFGSPLLLWLLPRLRVAAPLPVVDPGTTPHRRRAEPLLVGLTIALVVAFVGSLLLGRTPSGAWALAGSDDLAALLPWRAPRALAALCAGAMLAAAGVILQRTTRNPMASPEVLGVGAGAALGLVVVVFAVAVAGHGLQLAGAAGGAFAVLGLIVLLGRRSGFGPERVLLAGIAIGALLDALVGVVTAGGDPRSLMILNWMSGSTYQVDGPQAAWCAGGAILLIGAVALCSRWLDLMPLGDPASAALGLDLARVRLILLGLAAGATAAATLLVGPLTFVGLTAPHLAVRLGLQRALSQLAGAVLAGALVMVTADWLGRMAAFPWQMPAGLIATLIGGPALIWLLARR
nr:Fe(3+)-hydroxamate ABC transporter permease FhuB [Rhodoplanes tepidamans]